MGMPPKIGITRNQKHSESTRHL